MLCLVSGRVRGFGRLFLVGHLFSNLVFLLGLTPVSGAYVMLSECGELEYVGVSVRSGLMNF